MRRKDVTVDEVLEYFSNTKNYYEAINGMCKGMSSEYIEGLAEKILDEYIRLVEIHREWYQRFLNEEDEPFEEFESGSDPITVNLNKMAHEINEWYWSDDDIEDILIRIYEDIMGWEGFFIK